VDVAGHTDSTGSLQHNQLLSERRALSVANYLTQQGIDNRRFDVRGYGPTQPVATNATEAGRAQNRRVEIQISPLTE
jgi:outer membrane protein OmpA-like peptidoglycan-associated protein